ncbi:hypothetical protein CC78DRAFT_478450 [Lojkania enalia]|uniref:S1 motif domain-containing protein n=1 Tax=Lojkania enalia TaxID=147567 RepID=A0A9P4K1M6_9PLEO|nr:hypothetical protein CC78DRAFT_478450 [Didymosphaeria enalia]
MALPSIALPGQLLGPSNKYLPGPGTHIYESQIYASIAGPVISSPSKPSKTTASAPTKSSSKLLPLLSIQRTPSTSALSPGTLGGSGNDIILPEVESVVLARVLRLGPRFASIEILVVGESVCREGFQGLIRREDIRATEKDKVKVEECFRVGDLVRGMVISLGDQSNYYISTAQNEYGVIIATSEAGNNMYPISWKEFRDPKTGATETRKVAKPF